MSSPIGQRAQIHHVHRNSSHVGGNTHVTVTPPPSTPTHHRANSSGGSTTSSGSSLLSTLTSPESDTTSLVTGECKKTFFCYKILIKLFPLKVQISWHQ